MHIKPHHNGYIVENNGDIFVVGEETEEETMIELLYTIAEALGEEYDKWSDGNLNISWDRKGHRLINK